MRPPEIVVVEERVESESSVERGWIGSAVSPTAQESLDESFGLSVGAGTVGPGAQMAQAEALAGRGEAAGYVAGTVVGHDARDVDSMAGVPGDQPSKEGDSGGRSFISQDFGISQTGSVVHGNMDELPTSTSSALFAVASNAMADDLDAAQLLDIDVDELARQIPLIAANGLPGVEILESGQTRSNQDASYGGRARADSRGDLRSGLPAATQLEDLLDDEQMGLTGRTMRPRAAINQPRLAGLPIPAFPFRSGSAVNTGRLGGAGYGDACLNALDHQHSTGRASSGILVKLHLGSFGGLLALDTSSLTDLGPDGQLPYGNNVLRNHT